MTIQEFETELKTINKDLSIRPNNVSGKVADMFPDVNKLASILYCGVELCTIPNYDIFDEKNANYGVDLRSDGRFIPHRTRPEALAVVKEKIQHLQEDKDYADSFFGRGEYSEAALRRVEPEPNQVVEDVPIELKEVKGGMIEAPK